MEFNFQTISIIVAALLLLIILGTLAYTMSSSKKNGTIPWPPVVGVCPDYWEDLSGNGSQCVGIFGLTGNNTGSLTQQAYHHTTPYDFTTTSSTSTPQSGSTNFWPSSTAYSGSDPICAKRIWAQSIGNISWDGVTYGISQPTDCTV
jgi:hypothetical protein